MGNGESVVATLKNPAVKIYDGEKNRIEAGSLDGKMIGLYFSAHWCPPCREFTPRLVEKYNEIVGQGHQFEIVFVSSDRSQAEAEEYFAEHPWKMLGYEEKMLKQILSSQCGVQGIPSLALFDENGSKITDDGRTAIMTTSFEKLKTFEADKQEAERKLAEVIDGLPEEITHPSHPHPLKKMESVYGGRGYGCNVCNGGGKGWAYQCSSCGFDAHPKCVCEF